ncbi:hypothetical protein I7I53_02861 [Histoplasma capsulatum var. duboisii H88]|uniref:Uncharacterized protein n=1 Tax=Ajellomyces capsulatus (strain H88) TaxID=544711 RepID=A0A8A1LR60_AJEC8|nr:hypothetical protein I7I53_02861 [Histoplasma capsulatum var. duboisii H88]
MSIEQQIQPRLSRRNANEDSDSSFFTFKHLSLRRCLRSVWVESLSKLCVHLYEACSGRHGYMIDVK